MFILLTYLYIWILTLRTKVLNKFCSMRFRIRESSRLWGILLRSHFKGLWNYLIRRKLPLIFLAFFFNKNVPLNVATKYFKKAPKLVWTCSSWIRLKGITFFAVMKRCMQIGFNFHKKNYLATRPCRISRSNSAMKKDSLGKWLWLSW